MPWALASFRTLKTVSAFFVVLVSAGTAASQTSTTGALRGTVTDALGCSYPGSNYHRDFKSHGTDAHREDGKGWAVHHRAVAP